MKLVYICSPYRAEDKETLQRNIDYAKELTKESLLRGECPVAPHLYMTQCLDDNVDQERTIGLEAGIEILRKCDRVIVGMRYGISKGMKAEIKKSGQYAIQILFDDDEEEDIKESECGERKETL